ncbi:Peptidase family C25 [Methanophagales archaeon]|nr:Peptidase family C25 [Methanophagales archaeon]
MYAIEEDTGEKLFSYQLGHKADETTQVAISNGMIYFSGSDGTCALFALGLGGMIPKIHNAKVEGVDFHRNVVKGQINPFKVILRNYGDRDEFDVKLKMGREEILRGVYLNETETKTIPFEIDTSDMPLGINKGQVVISKGKRLDYLNLTMLVASEFEASSLIVTNLKRMTDKWGNDTVSASKLKEKLIELSFHPTVNGIIVGVENETNCSNLYDEWDNDKGPEKANEIAKAIKKLIDTKFKEYLNIEYLVVVGDDRIIPFYRILDNTSEPFIAGWDTERNYQIINKDSTVGSALHRNMFLTDNIYAADRPIEWETAAVSIPELFVPVIPVGRLVESPEDISAVIDAFFQQEYVNPDKIFVSGSDFMKDSAALCSSIWEKKTKGDVTVVVNETVDSFQQIKDEFLNINSNNIVFVFQHAEHERFLIHYGNITSQDVSQSLVDLNNTIICSLGCHSGLNVPPNALIDDLDLVQAFAQKGVLAYIAPTGYSIGLRRTIGAHELLISYLTKHLCEGRDVGTALMQAKQEYWATNYDFNYIDEKVFESTTLYGLPMVRINIPRSKVKIKSMEVGIHKEQPDTLVIHPLHIQNSTPDGNYYMTPSRELLSDPGKPVQPKEIRIFYPTSARVLRGAVMNSSKYHQNKSFTPLIDAYMQSHEIPEFKSYRIENWYPAQIFKINSIRYPKDPTQSRQYLIIITGQYKGRTLPDTPGEERIYEELSFDLYYARADEETQPPVIMEVSPIRINDTINITVIVRDESGIQRVLVTYTDINGDWGEWRSKASKLEEGDLWSCNISAKEGIEFFVQAVDNAGNAAVVEQWRI